MNIRRAARYVGRTLPRDWVVVLCIAAYVGIEALGLWLLLPVGPEREQFLLVRDGFLLTIAAAYGFGRVLVFHPAFRTDYRDWLANTPWQLGKPLLLGPVYLVWQDLLVVGALCLAQYNAVLDRTLLPAIYLIGYHVAMAVCCWATGVVLGCYVLGFATAVVVRTLVFPPYAFGLGALLYAVSFVALRATLARFPWEQATQKLELWKLAAVKQDGKQRRGATWTAELLVRDGLDERLGWPFGVMDTHDPGIQVPRRDGFLVSLLAGWWMYALMAIVPEHVGLTLALVGGAWMLVGGVCGRLGVYCQHYRPPISLWGRIATLRWIVPGYDIVFIGPLAAILAGSAIAAGGFYANLPPSLYLPAAVTVVLTILLTSRPSLREWRTTGNHRVVFGTPNKQKFVEH